MTDEERCFARVAEALRDSGIQFMVVGSHASSLHGIPRSTNDIDVVIDPSTDQLEAFLQAIGPGAYVNPATARMAIRSRSMFNVIDFESGLKCDFMFLKSDPFAAEEFRRRQLGPVLGGEFPVATAEDAILAKLSWDKITPSEKQLRDVVGILEVQRDQLDLTYLRQWAAELGLAERFEEVLAQAAEE